MNFTQRKLKHPVKGGFYQSNRIVPLIQFIRIRKPSIRMHNLI